MEHKEAQAAVSAIIEAAGFKVRCVGGNETRRDDWVCDAWHFTLERQHRPNPALPYERFEFPFYTGTGHRKANKVDEARTAREYGRGTRAYNREIARLSKPVAPHIADLAYSWILDGEAINESFNDWCANFGSDPDSIKALNTYQECCKTGEQLRKMFTREQLQALRDALQDY